MTPLGSNYTSAVDIWALEVNMRECLNIRPAKKYWIRARSEWCKELLVAFQATSDATKGPIRAYLTYVMGRALLRQNPVARLGGGDTLTYFAGFFQKIQFMDDAADREAKRSPGCIGMPSDWSDSLSLYCAQEMRAKKFLLNMLHTDKKEDAERPQKAAEADGANSQKKANHKPAEAQPRNIHVGMDGQTTVTPKPTAKAGTAQKASSGPKVSHAAQPRVKRPTVSSGRKHGREGDEAEEAAGRSFSKNRKRG